MSPDIDHPEVVIEPSSPIQLADLLDLQAVTPTEIRELRHAHFPLGLQSLADAEALFAIDRSAAEKSKHWSELFVELVTDFVVWGERPSGVVDAQRATWVLAQVDLSRGSAGIALLVNIIDEAHLVPSWFAQAVRVRALDVFETPDNGRTVRKAA